MLKWSFVDAGAGFIFRGYLVSHSTFCGGCVGGKETPHFEYLYFGDERNQYCLNRPSHFLWAI